MGGRKQNGVQQGSKEGSTEGSKEARKGFEFSIKMEWEEGSKQARKDPKKQGGKAAISY